MRSIKRPLVATGTAVLLALSFAACGDDGDGKADDAGSEATESTGSTDGSDGSDGSGATDASSGATDGAAGSDGPATGAAGAATTEEFCAGVLDVVKVSTPTVSSKPSEAQWVEIQEAYADLGEIGAPADIPAREGEGFEIAIEAITSLSYAEAEKAFGSADGTGIPGVSKEDNDKASAFYLWAGKACPELSGGAPAE